MRGVLVDDPLAVSIPKGRGTKDREEVQSGALSALPSQSLAAESLLAILLFQALSLLPLSRRSLDVGVGVRSRLEVGATVLSRRSDRLHDRPSSIVW